MAKTEIMTLHEKAEAEFGPDWLNRQDSWRGWEYFPGPERFYHSLRTPGINMTEKAVLTQRAANMTAAQGGYLEKQKKALLQKGS